MKNPFVSIIIPNYNHTEYLDERINSVLNQDYRNFEIIILDDKSTDSSINVIEKYRNNRYVSHIIYNEKNSGSTFIQWDRGIQLARGELIWIAESDDSCDSHMLNELVRGYIMHNNCVLSVCRSITINSNKEITGKKFKDQKIKFIKGKDFIIKYLSWGNFIPNVSSAIFSRDVALELDKAYMNYKGAGDHLFWILLSEYGNVALINKQLNYFRRHNNVVTSKKNLDGTNSREGIQIFNYLDSRKYLNPLRKLIVRSRNISIIDKLEITPIELKNNLYEEWDCNIDLIPFYNLIAKIHDVLLFKFRLFL